MCTRVCTRAVSAVLSRPSRPQGCCPRAWSSAPPPTTTQCVKATMPPSGTGTRKISLGLQSCPLAVPRENNPGLGCSPAPPGQERPLGSRTLGLRVPVCQMAEGSVTPVLVGVGIQGSVRTPRAGRAWHTVAACECEPGLSIPQTSASALSGSLSPSLWVPISLSLGPCPPLSEFLSPSFWVPVSLSWSVSPSLWVPISLSLSSCPPLSEFLPPSLWVPLSLSLGLCPSSLCVSVPLPEGLSSSFEIPGTRQ